MTMRTLILTTLLLMGSVFSLRAATTQSASQPANNSAPLLTEPRTHDPTLIREGNFYYVYNTGLGIQAKRSTDLLHWERLPPVFARPPAWATKVFPRAYQIWAPDLSFFNHQFHLYYCLSNFGKNRSIIACATNPTLDPASPNYHWTDHGKVLESFPTDPYNAIDPAIAFDDTQTPPAPYLTFGSFWDGIHLLQLSPISGLPDPHPSLYSLAARPKTPDHPIEAPCIIHRNNFFYLLVSFDFCCRGATSTYRMMIGRSEKITGPYLDKTGKDMRQGGGTLLLAGDPKGRIRGPGGGIIYHDPAPNDRWLLVHHFYDAYDRGMSKLQIRPITWSPDNWPQAGNPLTDETQNKPQSDTDSHKQKN